MVTKNPRVNVLLDPDSFRHLRQVAHREGTSISLAARLLIREALVLDEDMYWAETATERDLTWNKRKSIPHSTFWKRALHKST